MKTKSEKYLISSILIISLLIIFPVIVSSSPTGYFSLVDIAPEGYVFEEPDDLSQEEALLAFEQAENDLMEVRNLNLSTFLIEDMLSEAEQSYGVRDYLNVFKLTQLITFIKIEKIEFIDKRALTEEKEKRYYDQGINTQEGLNFLEQAEVAFSKDQIDESKFLLNKANSELEKASREYFRVRRIVFLGKNFILRYWWQNILFLIFLGVTIPPLVKKIRKKVLAKKLKRLNEELEKLKNSIKSLQKSCFIEKKTTPDTYKLKASKFEERIAEIKHTIPVLQAQLDGKKVPPTKKNEIKGILKIKKCLPQNIFVI